MGFSGINVTKIKLDESKWPGHPIPGLGKPADGWDGTTHSCVTSPVYPIGTKISQYYDNTVSPGYATMMYMQFHDGTDLGAAAGDVSDGYGMCFMAEGTATADGTIPNWLIVTNDLTNSDGTKGGAMAVPLADLSSDQFGWFWVGGVFPYSDCTARAGDIKVTGDISLLVNVNPIPLYVADDGTNCASFESAVADASAFFAISSEHYFNNLVGWTDVTCTKSS